MRKLYKRAKFLVKVVVGKSFFIDPEVQLDTRQFGEGYGAWSVLTPELDSDSVVYSVGVGEDIGFDLGLIDAFGMNIHAFDPTPRSIRWVKGQSVPRQFLLHEYGVASFDGTAEFTAPDNPEFVSHSIVLDKNAKKARVSMPVKRLQSIMHELGHRELDILKLDIEGAEYDVVADLLHSGVRPKQLLVELHHRFPNIPVSRSKELIKKLRVAGYRLFFVSASKEEFCFVLQ